MKLDEIRRYAERTLQQAAEAPHPMAGPTDAQIALARFAIATLNAIHDHVENAPANYEAAAILDDIALAMVSA